MSAGRVLHLDDVARGLGWFSVALGLAEMRHPGKWRGASGLGGSESCSGCMGIRETAAGVGLLLSGQRAPWLLARAGGDMLDIDTLGCSAAAEPSAWRRQKRNAFGVADNGAGCAWRGAAEHGAEAAPAGAGL